MRFLLYKTLKDKRRLGKIAVFNCILYDASRRMANKLLFYSVGDFHHCLFMESKVPFLIREPKRSFLEK